MNIRGLYISYDYFRVFRYQSEDRFMFILMKMLLYIYIYIYILAQVAGAVEYTGCTPTNACPVYDTKQSVGDVPVMLDIWGLRTTPSLPSLPGPLYPRQVAPARVLSMG